jgi:hypothetical protein
MVATIRKSAWAFDLDAGHDRFDIAARVEQRRQRRPAFLTHAIALIEDRDTTAQHCSHQRRRYVSQLAFTLDDRRYQQIFGTRVDGRLQDVTLAPSRFAAAYASVVLPTPVCRGAEGSSACPARPPPSRRPATGA